MLYLIGGLLTRAHRKSAGNADSGTSTLAVTTRYVGRSMFWLPTTVELGVRREDVVKKKITGIKFSFVVHQLIVVPNYGVDNY